MNGKGDKQRPEQVPGAYARGWERIFGSGPEETAKDGEMMEIAGVPFQIRLDESIPPDTAVMLDSAGTWHVLHMTEPEEGET